MTGRTERLRELLSRHVPATPRETRSLRQITAYLDWLAAPFDETADPTHVTASAVVVSTDGAVALHLHKRLGLWLQPGGHIEADEPPEAAARREVQEELGLDITDPDPPLLHVDVHEGPRGHVHLDLRYRLEVPDRPVLAPAPDESPNAEWFSRADALAVADVSLADALRRL